MNSNNHIYKDNSSRRSGHHHSVKSRRLYGIKILLIRSMIFCAITLFSVLSLKYFTFAQDSESSDGRKLYKSVTIYCGDTVESISSEYIKYGYADKRTFTTEICHINNISSYSELVAGNYLIIPYIEPYSI